MAESRCPICGKTLDSAAAPPRPFCSRRCADIDLGRWFGETYRVPGDAQAEPLDDGAPDDGPS